MFFDPTMLLLIPAFLFGLYAQNKIKRSYRKYSQVRNAKGLNGYQVATEILRRNGLDDVKVEEVPGELSDHYDPRDKTVRLSSHNFHEASVAALSIAAHEVGHALQHAKAYMPLEMRHSILPIANIGSTAAFPLAIGGLLFGMPSLVTIGIFVFTGVIVFQAITLPVEFNASSRALTQLSEHQFLSQQEISGAKKMLNAAALTYVAAAAMAVTNLIRLLALRGMMDD